MIVFIIDSSNSNIFSFIYGGNGVLAAYKTVAAHKNQRFLAGSTASCRDLIGRVRFPLAALNTNYLCFLQAEVLRTESQAKLENICSGQLSAYATLYARRAQTMD